MFRTQCGTFFIVYPLNSPQRHKDTEAYERISVPQCLCGEDILNNWEKGIKKAPRCAELFILTNFLISLISSVLRYPLCDRCTDR